MSLAWLATLAKLDWIRSIRPSNHSWDPFAGEIVCSDFVWSVCQSLCSPTSPRLGPREMDVPSFHRSWISLRFRKRHSGRDGCIVTRIFRSPCDLAAVQTWRLIWNTFLVAIGWRFVCKDWRSFDGCCVNLERWYGFLFGCRRIFSDWAGFWIALKNGRRCICVLIGRLWYGLYGYTMCIGTCMDLQERYRSG